jgi:acetyltransferase-like isoleucine patch superfamily enzyme
MLKALSALSRWFGDDRGTPVPPSASPALDKQAIFAAPSKGPRHASEEQRALIRAACDWADDTAADDVLMAAIDAEIHARRAATATLDGPSAPRATDLRVRRHGLPDWWDGRRNLFLCAPDVRDIRFHLAMMAQPPQDQIVIAGRGVLMPELHFAGTLGLVMFGDNTVMLSSACTVGQDCTVLIGQNTTATWMCGIDCRNGGILLAGEDNMWAGGVTFYTDDTHAIRDAATGKRLNLRGGRIVLEKHIWVGDATRVMGDSYIEHDAVIGMGSIVKGRRLPANTVSVGRPAKPFRGGVTWTRDDGD